MPREKSEETKCLEKYKQPDGRFKADSKGKRFRTCVKAFQKCTGRSEERASGLCAYLYRRKGGSRVSKDLLLQELYKFAGDQGLIGACRQRFISVAMAELNNLVIGSSKTSSEILDSLKEEKVNFEITDMEF